MNDPLKPPLPYSIVPPVPGTTEETDDDTTESGLPAHEIDADDSVGAGITSKGGTAVARGTGTIGGQAQGWYVGPDDDDDDEEEDDDDEDD